MESPMLCSTLFTARKSKFFPLPMVFAVGIVEMPLVAGHFAGCGSWRREDCLFRMRRH